MSCLSIRADDVIERAPEGIDLDKDSMESVYDKFGLEPGTKDFIGHAMALYLDDEYVNGTLNLVHSLSTQF